MAKKTLFAGLLSLIIAAPASAAGLQGEAGDGELRTPQQRALIFWRKGYQDMALQADYLVKSGELSRRLAWVIPVPEAPIIVGSMSAEPFLDAFRATDRQRGVREAVPQGTLLSKQKTAPITDGYAIGPIEVGRYKIKTLKHRGLDAAKEVNSWLRKRRFEALPVESLHDYLKRGWTFVLVEVDARKPARAKKDSGALKPLRLVFRSKDLVLPLKIASHRGPFRSEVSILTDRPLPLPSWLAKKGYAVTTRGNGHSPGSEQLVPANLEFQSRYWNLRARQWGRQDSEAQTMVRQIKARHPKARTALFQWVQAQQRSPLGRFPNLWITRLEGANINGSDNRLEDWPDDFTIDMKDFGRRLSDQELELLGGGRVRRR